jgi:glycosyltransferase involved in cell wall biosynthesis
MKNILILDASVPQMDRGGATFRMYQLIKIFKDLGHSITFIPTDLRPIEPYCSRFAEQGIRILCRQHIDLIKKILPEGLATSYCNFFIRSFIKHHGKEFDTIILSRRRTLRTFIGDVRTWCPDSRIIYDTEHIAFLRLQRFADLENSEKDRSRAADIKKKDLRLMKQVHSVWVVSEEEQALLQSLDPELHVDLVSTIHEVFGSPKGFDERAGLMFIGSYAHKPNVDAMLWFVKEVFPTIIQHIPDIRLYIIGSRITKEIKDLASENAIAVGYVENPKEFFEMCRIMVAPIRYGAGVKVKIAESMSYGLPVVTTTIGSEGMHLADGMNALIADEPREFAEKVCKLYSDGSLWSRLSENSIDTLRKNFSYELWKQRLDKIIG